MSKKCKQTCGLCNSLEDNLPSLEGMPSASSAIVVGLNLVTLLRGRDVYLGSLFFSGLRLSVVAATALTLLELLLVYAYVRDGRVFELPTKQGGIRGEGGEGKAGSRDQVIDQALAKADGDDGGAER